MKRQGFVPGLICLGVFFFRINMATAGELIGTFGPVTIEARHMPTRNLAGFTTWTLSASSPLDIRAFDFAGEYGTQFGDPYGYGFFGPMNQVGQRTVFVQYHLTVQPPAIIPYDLDSLFLVNAADVVVPAGFSSESSSHLRAIFARIRVPFENPLDFVQLVVPNAAQAPVQFRGLVAVGPIDNLQEITVFGTIPPIPEPATIALLAFALLGSFRFRARKTFCKKLNRATV